MSPQSWGTAWSPNWRSEAKGDRWGLAWPVSLPGRKLILAPQKNLGTAVPVSVGRLGTLTLQEVGCQEGSCGVRAGQTFLQKVSLKLQGKQVSRRRQKHTNQAQGSWDTRSPYCRKTHSPAALSRRCQAAWPHRARHPHGGRHTTRWAPDRPEPRFPGGSSQTRTPRVTQTEPHARFCGK